jgi:hypothetical protein
LLLLLLPLLLLLLLLLPLLPLLLLLLAAHGSRRGRRRRGRRGCGNRPTTAGHPRRLLTGQSRGLLASAGSQPPSMVSKGIARRLCSSSSSSGGWGSWRGRVAVCRGRG